jgi:hypothetical protein
MGMQLRSPPTRNPSGNLLDLLGWIAARPRTYAEAMEAWRTSCPRLSAWEDAIDGGLVRVEEEGAGRQGDALVVLTGRGAALLGRARSCPAAAMSGSRGGVR